MGAITLNTLVCGLLYHPVEQHMKIVPLDDGIDNEALTLDESIGGKQESAEKMGEDAKFASGDDESIRRFSDLSHNQHNVVLEITEKTSCKPEKATCKPEKKLDYKTNDTVVGLRYDVIRDEIPRENTPNANEFRMTIRPSQEDDDDLNSDTQNLSRRGSAGTEKDVKSQLDPLKIRKNPKEDRVCDEEPKRDDVCSKSSKTPKRHDDKKTPFFDLSVLRDPIYLVILISNSTSAISNTNFMILLPSYAIAEGFDKNSSALLLSIVSALDLVGRIGGASLSDIDFVPKYYYFVCGLGTSGIALALLPMATSYTMLSFFCGLFGLSSGMYIGITTVILADMLGTEKLSSSYGISLFVNGVLQLVGPPICGVIFENILTYKPIFLAFGIILILGTALWAVVPLINRNNKKDIEAI